MPPPKTPRVPHSKIHRKIVLFFTENQGSIDTPRGVSAWVNEGLKSVREALEDLVRAGILKAHRTSSTVAYSCELAAKDLARLYRPKR
jgi:hypothetical protein